jgi:hypothetical protein
MSLSNISGPINTVNIQSLAFLINLTSYLNAMKKNITMNNGLVFVLLFGTVMLLLIGGSYDTSIATSSSSGGETEKIPLYYASTRNP